MINIICRRCGLDKSFEDFQTTKHKNKKDEVVVYKNSICKQCITIMRREKYANDEDYRKKILSRSKICKEKKREHYLEKRREWRLRNRERINAKLRDFHQNHKKKKSPYYYRKLEYSKEYAKSHIKERNEWRKSYCEKIRNDCIELLGRKCQKCGNSDLDVLEFDHIKPICNKERSIFDVKFHPELYQLLCANCHRKKTRIDMRIVLCKK